MEVRMTRVNRAPARLSTWAATGLALLAFGTSGFYSWFALPVAVLGLLVLVLGVSRGTPSSVSTGAFGLFLGSVVAGVDGAPTISVLVGVTCVVLAWDAGRNAISVGNHLGSEASTRRVEVVHLAGSFAVGAVTIGLGYGLFLAGPGAQSISALVLLVIAAVLLVAALD